MKIVYLLFFMHFFCFSQQKSIDENKCKYALRTDGFYVFDNEIDTVLYQENAYILEQIQILKNEQYDDEPEKCNIEKYFARKHVGVVFIGGGSRKIELISFFSDTLGTIHSTHYTENVEGVMRLMEDRRNGTYKECIPQEHEYNAFYDFWQNDSCKLGFSRGSLDYFRTDYNGTLYEDSLVLTVDKIIDTFNPPEDRTYHFYTKEELLEKYGGQSKK